MKTIKLVLLTLLLISPFAMSKEIKKGAACYAIYDAGSSGTRLTIYKQKKSGFKKHKGPKSSALADPIRQNRGKTMADMSVVVDELISGLDKIKKTGPLKKGKAKWKAFNWEHKCNTFSVRVYATAGMRIAEQENSKDSKKMWALLTKKLKKRVGKDVPVIARTLTGYEEGLYAWLAVKSKENKTNFGIVEMGGASVQITLPCATCDIHDHNVNWVHVNGNKKKIYSYSFLGLGRYEASKTLGLSANCANGIGEHNKKWTEALCANDILIKKGNAFKAPYNYQAHKKNALEILPQEAIYQTTWFLTGAFKHLKKGNVQKYCGEKVDVHTPATSCFIAVYLNKLLQQLNIAQDAPKSKAKWTLGAAICSSTHCLKDSKPLTCNWLDKSCL